MDSSILSCPSGPMTSQGLLPSIYIRRLASAAVRCQKELHSGGDSVATLHCRLDATTSVCWEFADNHSAASLCPDVHASGVDADSSGSAPRRNRNPDLSMTSAETLPIGATTLAATRIKLQIATRDIPLTVPGPLRQRGNRQIDSPSPMSQTTIGPVHVA